MGKSKRVVFSFDERSYDSLEDVQRRGKFNSLADAVRESLQISRALQNQDQQGFSEVVVRNPKTGEERVMVIPSLHSK
ncbi:MAG: hypothetical protein KF886_05825 [Candidatus Hydrogenedentes bacterium]|nr:hypothetical protein [Candidatus Hydrogenedentota bacterium]